MGSRRGSKWWRCSVHVIAIGRKRLDRKISMLVSSVVSKQVNEFKTPDLQPHMSVGKVRQSRQRCWRFTRDRKDTFQIVFIQKPKEMRGWWHFIKKHRWRYGVCRGCAAVIPTELLNNICHCPVKSSLLIFYSLFCHLRWHGTLLTSDVWLVWRWFVL